MAESLEPTSARRRRLLFPLFILLIAGGIAAWNSYRETRRMEQIRQTILSLSEDIAQGRDVSARLDMLTPAPNPRLVEEFKSACGSPDLASSVDVKVTPGDLPDAGHFGGTGTHVATLRAGDVDLLYLRIKYDDTNGRVQIIGYRLPQRT
jgi:hypothetical protein